jgi:hypothetical protein
VVPAASCGRGCLAWNLLQAVSSAVIIHVTSRGHTSHRGGCWVLQVTGSRVPFEIEKQTALLSVLHSLTDGQSNIAALNMTLPNGEPTSAAFPTARCTGDAAHGCEQLRG